MGKKMIHYLLFKKELRRSSIIVETIRLDDESIATFNNVCMEEEALSEYLELLDQPPTEINSNHINI